MFSNKSCKGVLYLVRLPLLWIGNSSVTVALQNIFASMKPQHNTIDVCIQKIVIALISYLLQRHLAIFLEPYFAAFILSSLTVKNLVHPKRGHKYLRNCTSPCTEDIYQNLIVVFVYVVYEAASLG